MMVMLGVDETMRWWMDRRVQQFKLIGIEEKNDFEE